MMANRTLGLGKKKELAKIGMALSLGSLVATGFFAYGAGAKKGAATKKASGPSKLHIASGISLLAFSYWHWSLYQK